MPPDDRSCWFRDTLDALEYATAPFVVHCSLDIDPADLGPGHVIPYSEFRDEMIYFSMENPAMSDKPTLCVDFDGCLHSYESGWQGADVVADGPVPGAMKWLFDLTGHFDVAIYSARSSQPGGIEAMYKALRNWAGIPTPYGGECWIDLLSFPTEKPSAFLTIDDRAICFDGDFTRVTPAKLKAFQPWYKRDPRLRTFRVHLGPEQTTDVTGTHAMVNRQSHNGRVLDELLIYEGGTEVARFQAWIGYKEA